MRRFSFFLALAINPLFADIPEGLYRNNLKDREFGKEGPQNLYSEDATIAERQGLSENANFEVTPTQLKTDSSCYFGIHEKCTELVFQKIMYHRWELCSVFSNKPDDLMLSQIENLKSEGISEEELMLVRLQLLSQLNVHAKSADRLDEEMLAACRYSIENIQLADLSYLLSQFLNEEQSPVPA